MDLTDPLALAVHHAREALDAVQLAREAGDPRALAWALDLAEREARKAVEALTR